MDISLFFTTFATEIRNKVKLNPKSRKGAKNMKANNIIDKVFTIAFYLIALIIVIMIDSVLINEIATRGINYFNTNPFACGAVAFSVTITALWGLFVYIAIDDAKYNI